MPAKGWRADPVERLLSKTQQSDDGCWVWTGATTGRTNYGQTRLEGVKMTAHRAMWTVLVGPIGSGVELDHLCRNRLCVNPDHLEPVTPRTNWERGEAPSSVAQRTNTCKRGHPLSGDNLVPWQLENRGRRQCKACQRENQRRWKERNRDEARR